MFTTFAYRTLSLIGCSLALAAAAGTISPEDIRAEREIISQTLAREKAEAAEIFRASQQPLLYRRAMAGISRIEDKLSDVSTNAVPPEPDFKFIPLGDKKVPLQAEVKRKSYSTHHPTNGLATYLDTKRRRSPETYVSPEALAGGINILTPKATLQVPACLASEELENYLHMRCDRKFQPGDYWKELHAARLSEQELACLRYYDYLDANVPLRSVPVYQCTEIQGRNH